MDTWKKVAGMLAFFEQNQQARSYEAAGLLAVISNFAGSDWILGQEALNLSPGSASRSG